VASSIEGFRLSPQQERLWRLAGAAGGVSPYRAGCRVAVEGPLDRAALDAALAAVVERNELLRTDFRLLPGLSAPLQVVTEGSEPPLLRWSLSRLDAERHELLLSMPALLADAAGLDNLVAEIARCCAGPPDGGPVQYIDLSEWQHELLESEETQEGRDYWLRQPAAPAPVELPLAARGPAGPFAPRRIAVRLPAGGETAPEVLLAAWQTLLWRLGGRPEAVAVATLFEGRKFEELRDALGLFARHIPVQARLEEPMRLRDLAARLRQTLADHAEWQEYFNPGAEVPEVPYAFEHRQRPRRHAAGPAVFTAVDRDVCFDRFTARLVAEGADLELHYDEARLSARAAGLLAGRLAALLADAAARPDATLDDLEVVGPEERRLLLAEWNDTGVDLPGEKLVHRLVEARAARAPGSVAVEFEGGRWTYAELDERAGRLAGRLRRLGAGPEAKVAVCLDRSFEMVAALLAVWKAGGAYLPLDPSYPAERLAFLLDDARPAVLVTGPGAPEGLARPGLAVVDAREEDGGGAPAELPAGDPDQLAYVIYTSGSTGAPKGVMVSHRAIANRLLWMQSAFPLGEGDAVLQKTPFGFDASIWELFLPLLAGARLVLARPGGHQDPAWMARAVAEQGVTVLQLVPSMLAVFLEEDLAGRGSLRRLFCGGEALTPALRDRAFERLAAVELCNLYGPTECAIDVTFWPCRRDDGRPEVPIGRPIANDRVYLLDGRFRPVPAGQPGELYAAGEGLARGYLGRPDLTAERFLPDPFSSAPGGRLYRTGDLARQGLDGAVEFLGRADGQVKLRGVRLELGEVESCLARHPAVAEVAAAVREDGTRLIAWYVPRGGQEPAAEELRAFLAAKLPEAVLPSAFVRLQTLPRLASGKVDRAALPAPAVAGSEGAAPRTPTEEVLAARWAELLGVERLGIHDNVFTLGWHSLLATQFVSRLRRTFGVDLPIRSLFENPTVASLAERIDAALRGGPGREAPPIVPAPRTGPLPLSFAQQRLWFLDRLAPGNPFYNIPAALRFTGPLDVAALARSLSEVRRRQESLRTTFAEVDEVPVQVISGPAPLPLPVVDLAGLPEGVRPAEARGLTAAEALRPFDLQRGPLARAALLRLGPEEHVGLLTLHHIVSDGWSTAVLTREVAALYEAFASRRRPALPELPVQYADYAVWQRGWLSGEVLEEQVAYWRRQLEGAPPVLDLPADRERPDVQRFRGATRVRVIGAEVPAALAELGRQEGATSFMVLLAAGQALLGWTAGQDDVVVGTDVASRNRSETEGLIGFFINQLALRTRLGGDPTFRELLARVRETTLGAYAHQDLPFDKLVEILKPERRLNRSPLFQAKVNLLNVPAPPLELPGLRIEPLAAARETAQFDWILNLFDAGQGLVASVEYDSDLFDAATIDRMLGNFEALLRAVADRPDLRLSELAEVLEESDAAQRLAGQRGRKQSLHDKLRKMKRPAATAETVEEVLS
jgi:amino acid adenylation domain-containing protein